MKLDVPLYIFKINVWYIDFYKYNIYFVSKFLKKTHQTYYFNGILDYLCLRWLNLICALKEIKRFCYETLYSLELCFCLVQTSWQL